MKHRKPHETKINYLKRERALNPHPERVTDSQFTEEAFFDAYDLVQVKYEMLRRVETEGQTVRKAAEGFGYSRQSFYTAKDDMTRAGLAGLIPQKRGPRGGHKLTKEVLEYIGEVHEEDPSLGSEELSGMVGKRFGVTVHPRSVERGIERWEKKRKRGR